MSKAPFLINSKWRRRSLGIALCGLIGSAAALAALPQAATDQRPTVVVRTKKIPAPPAIVEAPRIIPFAAGDRLERMDQLQAELAQVRIEADIAKAKADIRNATSGNTGAVPAAGGLMPPIPTLTGQSFNLPPFQAAGRDAEPHGSKPTSAKPIVASYSMVEAWGNGADRQAVVRAEDGGRRIVRVGDRLGAEQVTAIANGVVTLRDSRGRVRTIN